MEYYLTKRNPETDDLRYVFKVSENIFVVVKVFSDSHALTVKVWDTNDRNLEDTMSRWNTSERYSPTENDISEVENRAHAILNEIV